MDRHEELSIGDFVLAGGEPAALCVLDAWRREQALRRTLERRPELLEGADLDEADRKVLKRLGSKPGDR
jgi:tRNA G37 N-methylase TrmD